MINRYYSNTDIKSFKVKFCEVVQTTNGVMPNDSCKFLGSISDTSFKVWSGSIGSGKLAVFFPVVDGEIHQRRQRLMITLAPRLGPMGIGMTLIMLALAAYFFVHALLSVDPDLFTNGIIGAFLVPGVILLMGFHYYYSASKTLINDLRTALNLLEE